MLSTAAILALIGIVIGAMLQFRNWKHQNRETIRKEQREAAVDVVQQLASLLDRRLYRQRRYLYALYHRADSARLDEARKEYNFILFEWNDNLGRFKAILTVLFDMRQALNLEGFHDRFQGTGKNLELYDRSGHADYPLHSYEEALNILGAETSNWVAHLLERINCDRLRAYSSLFHVSHSNWDNLSTSYLLKRLFGLTR